MVEYFNNVFRGVVILNFSKWQGLGNDFIIFHDIDIACDDVSLLAKKLCDRHFGIGADGLCLLESTDKADIRMRLINADGSEAEMCGNLIRCVAKHLYEGGFCNETTMTIDTLAGIIRTEIIFVDDNICNVKVDMGVPKYRCNEIPLSIDSDDIATNISVDVFGKSYLGNAISMGNPHFVIFVDDIENVDLKTVGPLLETASLFPNKCNIEFAQILSKNKVRMRVWERGAGITLACGTGTCATVAAGILNSLLDKSVEVILDGGSLFIDWADTNASIFMTGAATRVFSGSIDL